MEMSNEFFRVTFMVSIVTGLTIGGISLAAGCGLVRSLVGLLVGLCTGVLLMFLLYGLVRIAFLLFP